MQDSEIPFTVTSRMYVAVALFKAIFVKRMSRYTICDMNPNGAERIIIKIRREKLENKPNESQPRCKCDTLWIDEEFVSKTVGKS